MKKVVTMQAVADAARCSRAAVSLALRGDRSISEPTRERIAGIARRLGYQTNPLVSALMTMRRQGRPAASATAVLAYLTSHPIDNPWRRHSAYVGLFNGAFERAAEIGYRVEEFNVAAPGMTATRMRDILTARAVHAIVVAPLPHHDTKIRFDFSSFAAVGLGLSVHEPAIERVANDHFQSAALAVDECVKLGYRRIGLALSRETSVRLEHRWLAGYQFAIAQHGLGDAAPVLMPQTSDELPGAIPAWQKRYRPDVVIFDNSYPDQVGAVPADVGVVSLSLDSPSDAVSGIFQNYGLLGRVAVEHAAAKLYTNSFGVLDQAHIHLVAGKWVHGTTTPGPKRRRRPL